MSIPVNAENPQVVKIPADIFGEDHHFDLCTRCPSKTCEDMARLIKTPSGDYEEKLAFSAIYNVCPTVSTGTIDHLSRTNQEKQLAFIPEISSTVKNLIENLKESAK
jgi:hypothetical protein